MTNIDLALDERPNITRQSFGSRSETPSVGVSKETAPRHLQLAERKLLYRAGDKADFIFLIVSGAVALTRTAPDGRRHVLEILGPEAICGLVAGARYNTSAETLAPTVVQRIERAVLESSDRLQREVSRHLLRKVESFHDHTERLGRKSAVERVAGFLLELPRAKALAARKQSAIAHADMRIAPAQSDMADYLSLTNETVCRTLSKLKTMGLISMPSRRRIGIIDQEQLRALSYGVTV